MKKKVIIAVIVFMMAFLVFTTPKLTINADDFLRIDSHDVNKEFNQVVASNYISYTEVRENFNSYSNLQTAINNKIIMFNTAEELYTWSHDLKYTSSLSNNIKELLAASNYALGADIDYSVMKARRFMPIGYDFNLGGSNKKLSFSGTFDGRGFEINELELEIYSNFNETENNIVVVYSTFFSMFTVNEGTITDVGLINPTIDLNNEHATLRDFAYLVGKNEGTLENSYVIDTRAHGQAGMNVSAMKTEATTQKRAAGLVHTNYGTVTNSFFSGVSVINSDFMHVILEEPLYYFDYSSGVSDSVIYNGTRYGLGVPSDLYQVPVNGIANSESSIINGSSDLDDDWYHYPEEDGREAFPKRFGLDYSDGKYIIYDARDLVTFSRLLSFKTTGVGGGFNSQTYFINNDINMDDVSSEAYILTDNEFFGTLTANESQAQISNFKTNKGLNVEDGYHFALFYSLAGTVENLKLYNFLIYPTITENYTGQMFYVGSVAAKLNGGTIKNITLDSKIDFTNEKFKIGAHTVGALVGMGSGVIEKIYIADTSTITFGSFTYIESDIVTTASYLGGVIGRTYDTKLSAYNILNEGTIEAIAVKNLYVANNQAANFYVGGVIGYVNNTSIVKHNLGLLTNTGEIKVNSLASSSSITTYLGGVIGYSTGNMYDFSNTFGKFTNEGEFVYENDKNKTLYVAGVLNSNHSEAVEFTQIYNNNDLAVNQANTTVSALINHLSTNKLTISQAKSEGEIAYFGTQRQDIHGAVFTSSKTTELQLNYVEVKTDVYVTYTNNSRPLNIAGVTLNENANYLNVIYGGLLQVEVTGNNTSVIWVSGITKQLSLNKVMKNTMNEGTIHAYAKTTNTINTTVKSLYVGGLVNINESGDLHTQTGSMPVATKGIINSINRANMTSYFGDYKGIEGRINTFAGGIASINRGSIQDVVNTGDIRFANITSGAPNQESQFVDISGDVDDAGKTKLYKTGVVIGGISSVVTSGYSRIYDSINNGNILGQSYYYARSGGILGLVSPFDVSAGDVYGYTEDNDVTKATHLKHSVISNGINYGNVYAITSVIGVYRTITRSILERIYLNTGDNDRWPTQQNPYVNMNTKYGTEDRIALNSAAGGIIGSGLSVLKRMLNHGQIGATDAAGGIIGSIFVFSNKGWRTVGRTDADVGVTMVNINTAINYGDIRAVKIHSSGTDNNYFNSIYNKEDDKISEINNIFYDYNDNFITPTNPTNSATNSIRLFPEHKRGFGGIIGRIQRGGNQNMITNYVGFTTITGGVNLSNEEGSFDFIVNMNPNVDLIGRLDQNYNFSLSGTAFQFYDAVYYSAKLNDNTQAVFTGFLIDNTRSYTGYFVKGNNANVTRTRSGRTYTYAVTNAEITYQNANYKPGEGHQVGQRLTYNSEVTNLNNVYNTNSNYSFTNSTSYDIVDVPGGKMIVTSSSGDIRFQGGAGVPYISETPSSNSQQYVYHEDFLMRDENTTLTTGESITDYIYYATKSLLADRFQTSRPNGMYVLSTTAGSTFGSVLPRNFNVIAQQKISPDAPNNLDYNNVLDEYLISDDSHASLINLYKNSLYQTQLNEKSELLKDEQYLAMKDNNIGTIYSNDSDNIDLENKKIYFEVDLLTLGSRRSLSFTLTQALLPANALIAREKETQENTTDFQEYLKAFRDLNANLDIITGTNAPSLSVTLPTNLVAGNSYEVGKFVSYSEAAVMDDTFTDEFKTLYTVYIKIKGSTTATEPTYYQVSRDGASFNTNFNNISFLNNFTIKFRDIDNVLPNGHIVDEYLRLYYVDDSGTEHLVEKDYYSINSIPKEGTTFDTTISFNNLLRNGTYVLKGKTYNNQDEFSIEVDYNHPRTHEIYEFRPYTSTYYDGLYADFSFGYSLDLSESFLTSVYESKVYLARYTYTLPFLQTFSASSFFEIEVLEITDITDESDHYYTYQVDFHLKDGIRITKYITESKLAPTYYKNNVSIASKIEAGYEPNVAESFVVREAERTTFSLKYNMISEFYDVNNFVITTSPTMTVTTTSTGISYNVNNDNLNIIFDDTLDPAEYKIYVKYIDGNTEIPAGNLIIDKRPGTRAYLTNIKFSEFVPGIEYPDINAVNANNTALNTNYELGVYYRGIDYNNSDTANHKSFRIDGEVSGIPLNNYMPLNIVDYLPLGGRIQRKYYVNGVAYWSDLVNAFSTEEEIIESLSTDFTIDQATGELQFDNEGNPILPYVEYRVVSETDYINGNSENGVTYFISVRDILYSFLAVFTYKYYDGVNYHFIDEVEAWDNKLLVLNIYNYNVTKDGLDVSDDEVELVPEFDAIKSIQSTMTQFYYVSYNVTNNQYVYGLGTNFSGFYHFFLDTDKVYYIREGTDEGEDLATMSSKIEGEEGYFYYINSSPITRTRYFTIIITDDLQTKDTWGLTDYSQNN